MRAFQPTRYDMMMYSLTRVDNVTINMQAIIMIAQVCWSRAQAQQPQAFDFLYTIRSNPGSPVSH